MKERNNMKKVLFVATITKHITTFHLQYLKMFKEHGYEVHVATDDDAQIPYCDVHHKISIRRNPFKIDNLKAIKQLKRIINEEKFDIVHCHTPMGSVVARLAAKKARKNGTRVIYTAHGYHFYKGAPLINWLLYYPVEKWLAKYTDTQITITQEDYDLVRKKFKIKDLYLVHGVGLDEEKFNIVISDEEKENLKQELKIDDKSVVCTYVAELNKNKNQQLLIKAIKGLKDDNNNVMLLLVGKGRYEPKLLKLIKKLKLEENVKLLGYRNDIVKILSITDIYLASSLREGLPVNVMEAMYMGLPIIAVDNRGHRELVQHNENGFIVEQNNKMANSIKNYIELLIKDNILEKKFEEKSQELIQAYTLSSVENEMMNIYFRKKKVIHILASNTFSGAENVACTIINNASENYDMYYCCPQGAIEEVLKEKKIKYIPIKKLSYREIKRVIKEYNPDIIHAHDNRATVLSSFFSKKCKIISHIHGNNKIMNKINLKTIIFNYCVKCVKNIIWVSKSSFEGYVFNEKIKNKSVIIYNVVDKAEIERKAFDYKCDKKFDLIFLGRIAYPKNPERLIEIVRLLKNKRKDIKLAIVGDGKERSKIEKLIKDYQLEENITLYGYKKNPYPILLNSKILIMTSIYEGTPMCSLEAFALNKPVISTPVDGLNDIIVNGKNGYLLNRNKDIADNIIKMLDADKYNKMTKCVQEKFYEYNNLNSYMRKIEKIYK